MHALCIAMPETTSPANSSPVDSQAAFFMFFSTNAPKHDAPVPKKKMFKQNANCIDVLDAASSS
jgi:hypothetical protein